MNLGRARLLVIMMMVVLAMAVLLASCSPAPNKKQEVAEEEPIEEKPDEVAKEEPEQEEDEPRTGDAVAEVVSEAEYVIFFIDHVARVFEAAELDREEEIAALERLADEYLTYSVEQVVPEHLATVDALYREAMEAYAKGMELGVDEALEAFLRLGEAVDELDGLVDLSEYD